MAAELRLVQADDFEAVRAAYLDVTENTPEIKRHARWVFGKHPTDAGLRSHVEKGELHLLMEGSEVAGMVAIVMRQDGDCESVAWAEDLASDQVATLHLLAVRPQFRGRALGGIIIERASDLARREGKRAMRLDVLRSNTPARRMYERAGFSYRGWQRLYAENTGWIDFLFYERAL